MRDLSLNSPVGEGSVRVTARRCWRALRVLMHLLGGVLEAIWLRAGRDPHRVVILNAKRRWCLRFRRRRCNALASWSCPLISKQMSGIGDRD